MGIAARLGGNHWRAWMWVDRHFLYWIRQQPDPEAEPIKALNRTPDYHDANRATLRFQILEKTLLHLVLRFVRVPRIETWPQIFTGPRKQVAIFLNEEWYRYERSTRRRIVLLKVFYLALKDWENDSSSKEVFDYLLYRLLTKKQPFGFDQPQHLDPNNWFREKNPFTGDDARVIPPAGVAFFSVLSADDTQVTTDRPLRQPVIRLHRVDDAFDTWWVALDLANGQQLETGHRYPVLGAGPTADAAAQCLPTRRGPLP